MHLSYFCLCVQYVETFLHKFAWVKLNYCNKCFAFVYRVYSIWIVKHILHLLKFLSKNKHSTNDCNAQFYASTNTIGMNYFWNEIESTQAALLSRPSLHISFTHNAKQYDLLRKYKIDLLKIIIGTYLFYKET